MVIAVDEVEERSEGAESGAETFLGVESGRISSFVISSPGRPKLTFGF